MLRHLLAAVAALFLVAPAQAKDLTIERLVASPSLNGPSIAGLQLSPDGSRVTFLKGKEENFRQQDLWEFDIETGERRLLVDSDLLLPEGGEQIDDVEKARRERMRISSTGIISYQWNQDGTALLFPVSGDVYYYDFDSRPRQLTATEETETDARISPKGRYVSYIRDRNLYVYDLETGEEAAFTSAGGGTIACGMAQFVVQEELSRYTGYWWHPEDEGIAFACYDEADVPLLKRYDITANGIEMVEQRYPLTGTTNASVALYYQSINGLEADEIDLGAEEDFYLARVDWSPTGEALYYQWLSRDQKQLQLRRADVKTGKVMSVIKERSDTWINVHDDLRFLEDGERFIWSSEQSGYRHLALYDAGGRKLHDLTNGKWAVDAIEAIDEENGTVYFSGFADGPTERHLYQVPLERPRFRPMGPPRKPTRVTQADGWHSATVSPSEGFFIHRYSYPTTPPQIALRDLDTGEVIVWLEENKLDDDHPYAPYLAGHPIRVYGQLTAEDGQKLDYMIMKPADFDETKRYPAVVHVYGGPHASLVRKSWSTGFNDILARNGYIVFTLDNRGASNRGHVFEAPLYRNMGQVEVADQKLGAEWLGQRRYVDKNRIGVWGWSYGGYMSVHMLAQNPETYAAGVSVAPVTDWKLYDTAYTERYMGHPDEEAEAYEAGSHFPYLTNIEDPLFVVHGMADDNVFFDNSVKLFAALQDKNIPFEMMTYPGKKHGIRGEVTRTHLWTDVLDFFDRALKDD